MAPTSSTARQLLALRNSTGYFFSHHPCSQGHWSALRTLAGSCTQARTSGSSLSDHTNRPAAQPALCLSNQALPSSHPGTLSPSPWPISQHAPASLHTNAIQLTNFSPQLLHSTQQLHSHNLQRNINSGGARKVIEQQEADEKEQELLKAKQTKFDRSLGARKAKNAEHQSVIAHMSDVRTPRSLLHKSQQQKWEVQSASMLYICSCLCCVIAGFMSAGCV